MTTPIEQKEESFDQQWNDFISLTKPGTFTLADHSVAQCFYTKGWLDAAALLYRRRPSELAKLGV